MSLDQNLFTLLLSANKDHPDVMDLVDHAEVVHYRKRRVAGAEYKADVYDPASDSLLASATAPSASSKTKVIHLYNPTKIVEFKCTGTLSFRWSFLWDGHEFEWKREECYLLRKPDPPVLIALMKETSSGRARQSAVQATVQIMDYNLNRFDIEDRKGLEIVVLTALLTSLDYLEHPASPKADGAATASSSTLLGGFLKGTTGASSRGSTKSPPSSASSSSPPPLPPAKPARKKGLDRIAEMQALTGEYNEVTIEDEGEVDDYAVYCSNLLEDSALLFITLRSAGPGQVPKVLRVIEETKWIRHRRGLSESEELHQYVADDGSHSSLLSEHNKNKKTKKNGPPRRIILDDDEAGKKGSRYVPPQSLVVHLSKIAMPELEPKRNNAAAAATTKMRG